jgi:hypothetical protein
MAEQDDFSGDAVQAVRTAAQAHHHLSTMADRKASMLMGASFVVFTIAVSQAGLRGHLPLAMLVLGVSAFLSALFAALAVMPAVVGPRFFGGRRNLMFFGSFADMDEDAYVAAMVDTLSDQRRFLEMMARDVYQNGVVLAKKKYRLLTIAYSIFIVGLVASVIAFVATGMR